MTSRTDAIPGYPGLAERDPIAWAELTPRRARAVVHEREGSGFPIPHDPLPGAYRPGWGFPCLSCTVRVRLVVIEPEYGPRRWAWRHVAGGVD